MDFLVAITESSYEDKTRRILVREGLDLHFNIRCYGTADNEMLEMLGLGMNEKTAFFGPIPESKVKDIYRALDRELKLRQKGAGIAFTLITDKASAAVKKIFFPNYEIKENISDLKKKGVFLDKKEEINKTDANSEFTHRLIITVTDRGNFETVKKAASAEGARGGTVFHGLGTGGRAAEKFLGITINSEKDVMFIVVSADECDKIMRSITKSAGLNTEGRGICFALPVTSAFGLAERI